MGHHLEKSGGGHVGAGDEPASSPRAEPQSLRHQGRPRPVARRLDSPLTHLRCTIAANPPSAPSGTPPRHSAQPPAHPPPARSSPPAPPGSAPESEPAAEAPGPSRRDDPRTDRPASSAPQTPVLAARPLPPESQGRTDPVRPAPRDKRRGPDPTSPLQERLAAKRWEVRVLLKSELRTPAATGSATAAPRTARRVKLCSLEAMAKGLPPIG